MKNKNLYQISSFSIISKHLIFYPTPSNINYFWNFGFLSGIFLMIQVLTGVFLAMQYTCHVDFAYSSIEHIMRDVNNGWLIRYFHANGASFFFLVVYLHMARGLFFSSYSNSRAPLWVSGVLIFILMMATAFLGYILPWGQMSFWGATVITNLFSAIPVIGDDIAFWLWGGYSVDNATLIRFFSLHYLLPFILLALVITHLFLLHIKGSTNPCGTEVTPDVITFYPYFYYKDLVGTLLVFSFYLFFVFYYPNYLGHTDNYIPANPLVTPAHIVPEWYFLPFYAILRAIPDKLGGVVAMGGALIALLLLPFLTTSYIRTSRFRPVHIFFCVLFLFNFLLLGWLGGQPVTTIYILLGRFSTIYYFFYLLIFLPIFHNIEKLLTVRNKIFFKFLNFFNFISFGFYLKIFLIVIVVILFKLFFFISLNKPETFKQRIKLIYIKFIYFLPVILFVLFFILFGIYFLEKNGFLLGRTFVDNVNQTISDRQGYVNIAKFPISIMHHDIVFYTLKLPLGSCYFYLLLFVTPFLFIIPRVSFLRNVFIFFHRPYGVINYYRNQVLLNNELTTTSVFLGLLGIPAAFNEEKEKFLNFKHVYINFFIMVLLCFFVLQCLSFYKTLLFVFLEQDSLRFFIDTKFNRLVSAIFTFLFIVFFYIFKPALCFYKNSNKLTTDHIVLIFAIYLTITVLIFASNIPFITVLSELITYMLAPLFLAATGRKHAVSFLNYMIFGTVFFLLIILCGGFLLLQNIDFSLLEIAYQCKKIFHINNFMFVDSKHNTHFHGVVIFSYIFIAYLFFKIGIFYYYYVYTPLLSEVDSWFYYLFNFLIKLPYIFLMYVFYSIIASYFINLVDVCLFLAVTSTFYSMVIAAIYAKSISLVFFFSGSASLSAMLCYVFTYDTDGQVVWSYVGLIIFVVYPIYALTLAFFFGIKSFFESQLQKFNNRSSFDDFSVLGHFLRGSPQFKYPLLYGLLSTSGIPFFIGFVIKLVFIIYIIVNVVSLFFIISSVIYLLVSGIFGYFYYTRIYKATVFEEYGNSQDNSSLLEVDLVSLDTSAENSVYKEDFSKSYSPVIYFFFQLCIIIIPIILIYGTVWYHQSHQLAEIFNFGFDFYLLEGYKDFSELPHSEQTSYIVFIQPYLKD
jgi:quinol-cytochrome oxidoreductase complex cytochrome b subunit